MIKKRDNSVIIVFISYLLSVKKVIDKKCQEKISLKNKKKKK